MNEETTNEFLILLNYVMNQADDVVNSKDDLQVNLN